MVYNNNNNKSPAYRGQRSAVSSLKSVKGIISLKCMAELRPLIKLQLLWCWTGVWSLNEEALMVWKLCAIFIFSKSVKGHNFAKMPDRVMALGQMVALVMMNKCVKFEDDNFNSMEVMGKIQYFLSL